MQFYLHSLSLDKGVDRYYSIFDIPHHHHIKDTPYRIQTFCYSKPILLFSFVSQTALTKKDIAKIIINISGMLFQKELL